ncbi:hypothetical protein BHE74_00024812 [Ensete ventricosum]|nr:hypothetical protein BHE74_00024812 [Ensete ventricosum]
MKREFTATCKKCYQIRVSCAGTVGTRHSSRHREVDETQLMAGLGWAGLFVGPDDLWVPLKTNNTSFYGGDRWQIFLTRVDRSIDGGCNFLTAPSGLQEQKRNPENESAAPHGSFSCCQRKNRRIRISSYFRSHFSRFRAPKLSFCIFRIGIVVPAWPEEASFAPFGSSCQPVKSIYRSSFLALIREWNGFSIVSFSCS